MNLSAWRHLSLYYRGAFARLTAIVVVSVGQALLVVPITWLVRYAFDTVIPSGAVSLLVIVGLVSLALNVANSAVTLWTRHMTLTITKSAIAEYRLELLNRLYHLSRAYFDRADLGKLQTNLVQDTERLDVMSNAVVALFIPSLLTSLALAVVLVFLNVYLFLVMIIVIPILLVVTRLTGAQAGQRVKRFQRAFEEFSKGTGFVLHHIDLTRIQTAEPIEIARQRRTIETLRDTSRRMAWFNAAYGLVQNGIVAVSGVLILILGGAAVARGIMTLGELLSFQVGVGLLGSSLNTMLSAIPPIIDGNESLTTLSRIWNADESLPYVGRKRIEFKGKITLDDVSFGYNENAVLKNVSLLIHTGTRVALVGENGAGKSTIANIVLGMYRPQRGRVCADDHPLQELDVAHLRHSIGVVRQEPLLFAGTILENITYGCPDASAVQVERAARLATAHNFIQELPNAYQTLIGEDGVTLSGGQRQQVALARALLRQPKLLILDEPTNHLDAEAVVQLLRNLSRLEPSPTILIISHDSQVVCKCQSIYRLKDGRVQLESS